ncbi:group 1 glycosyl transferase [Mycolicibacterium neoaurum]|uniref:Group 1 glycosyl transferase n=2 Tax=Mycolicibacterium neoaurum TaxID=1795 RepID=A0AAV2WT22_MYCNE|nr:group 1 glycosyl transferase [Mycolicibacterium neoaurum]
MRYEHQRKNKNPDIQSLGSRISVIGPLPPPVHGQSAVTYRVVSRLKRRSSSVRIANTSQGTSWGLTKIIVKLGRALAAMWALRMSDDVVYIAVNAGQGMWLTVVHATLARAGGARVVLHHHSYSYVRARKFRMVALARAAGPRACHIVLSRTMARDLRLVTPEAVETLVVGNAALVDQELLELPLKSPGPVVLGHMSNLCIEKGLSEVVDLAISLKRSGHICRLIVGGPVVDDKSRQHLTRAAAELESFFEYRGELHGEAKSMFFSEVTHFVFPSRYVHEAAPLVLYEALAAGVVCVATPQGSIAEQLASSPSFVASQVESFGDEALTFMKTAEVGRRTSYDSRKAYLDALQVAEGQLEDLVQLMVAHGEQ